MDLDPNTVEQKLDSDISQVEQENKRLRLIAAYYESFDRKQFLDEISRYTIEIGSIRATLKSHDLAKPSASSSPTIWSYVAVGGISIGLIASGIGAAASMVLSKDADIPMFIGEAMITGWGKAQSLLAPETREIDLAIWHDQKASLLEILEDCEKRAAELEARVLAHSNFNIEQVVKDTHDLDIDLLRAMKRRDLALARYKAVREGTDLYIAAIQVMDIELSELTAKSRDAMTFGRELSAATEGEQSRIRVRCNDELGNVDPMRLWKSLQSQIYGVKRNRLKLVAKAQERARVRGLCITRVVIDGNNMCHQSVNQKFIGLAALKPAVAALIDFGLSVSVIFDPSIRKLAGWPQGSDVERAWLRDKVGATAVMVVPEGTDADEYVLREAGDSHTAVISCDNFSDYRADIGRYPALLENRVFHHHITASSVVIPDFDLDIQWHELPKRNAELLILNVDIANV